jgi:hypothetical protein
MLHQPDFHCWARRHSIHLVDQHTILHHQKWLTPLCSNFVSLASPRKCLLQRGRQNQYRDDHIFMIIFGAPAHRCWRQTPGRMAERVLPNIYELAEPLAQRAKPSLKADLDSLGQGTSPGIKLQIYFCKFTIIHAWQNCNETGQICTTYS